MGAKLLVEHPDDDPDLRVELGRRQGAVEVAEVVVARQDEHGGAVGVGLAQHMRQAMVADDEPDALLGQVLGRVGGRPDGDHLLVAQAQLVDRPQTEVVEPADDDMPVHVGQSMGPAARSSRRSAKPPLTFPA